MESYLKAQFILSAPLPPEANNYLSDVMERANQRFFGEGGKLGKITELKVDNNNISITIDCKGKGQPHYILFRLRKFMRTEIGKKFRVGIREIKFEEYIITLPSEVPSKEIKIPFVKKIEYKSQNACIYLDPKINLDFVEKGAIERIVGLFKTKLEMQKYGAKKEHHKIVYTSEKKDISFREDPTKIMVKLGWIRRTSYRNQWIWGPEITYLANIIKKIWLDVVYKPLEFYEMLFPKYVPFDVWKKSGHLKGLYQGSGEFYFVSPPKTRDPAFWEDLCDYYVITKEIDHNLLLSKLAPPQGGLSYAQCPPFWQFVEGKTIDIKSLPFKVYDWNGPTYRYESGGAHGLERVDELHRIETLFIGTKDQVLELGQAIRDKIKYIYETVFEIEFREVIVIPWWIEQEGRHEADLAKDIGTFDYEAYIPYKGKREDNKSWEEIQNLSIIGTKYPKAFTVKISTGEELWSGCAGGSFERAITTFIAQHGVNIDDWPEMFLKYFKDFPQSLKFC
jgi:seryl-tRNA synthetase